MIVMGVLAQFMDPRAATALLLFPMLVSNTRQALVSGRIRQTWARYWRIATPLFFCLLIFSQFAARAPSSLILGLVGVAVTLFVVSNLTLPPLVIATRWQNRAQFITGAVAGAMGGLTSLWGPPLIAYLTSLQLKNDEFVAAMGLLLLVGTIPLTIGYMAAGLFEAHNAVYSLSLILPTLLGMKLGEFTRTKIDSNQFRNGVMILFFVLGLNLIRRSLT